jgi:hypothetical protein
MDKETKLEWVSSKEFDLYKVEPNRNGYGIFLYTDSSDPTKKELIFGLKEEGEGLQKAFLDYWCLRLNRAFVQGWCFARGYNITYPSKEYYEQLDELYEKWTKTKLKKNE